jgi:hypothetical protein
MLLATALLGRAQQNEAAPGDGLPPAHWASEAAQNELKELEPSTAYLRYRVHTQDAHGDRVRESIQSKEGTVSRLILRDGHPLTPEEDAAEHERLQAMLDSPAAFSKHQKGDANGRRQAAELIKMIPDAMIFSYAPGQPQRAERPAGEAPEIVIDYHSNPNWSPPTLTADALTGVEGRVWIDRTTHSMTKLEGQVVRGVNFGWFVAHVYPGGHFEFGQTKVSDGRWTVSRFRYHVDVRLLFKRMTESSDIEASDFSAVPPMSYQEAIRTLLASPLPKE